MVAEFSVQLTSYNIELLYLNLLLISEHKEHGDCFLTSNLAYLLASRCPNRLQVWLLA